VSAIRQFIYNKLLALCVVFCMFRSCSRNPLCVFEFSAYTHHLMFRYVIKDVGKDTNCVLTHYPVLIEFMDFFSVVYTEI